jgi:predicted nucleic acid-binding protein
MKLLFDSSIIVEVDRGNKEVVELMKKLVKDEHQLFISSVTVAEILTGAYQENKVKEARKVLGQFQWIDMNGSIADKTGELMATLYKNGKPIEFQDVVIAASAEDEDISKIITLNQQHFNQMEIKAEITTPQKLEEKIY